MGCPMDLLFVRCFFPLRRPAMYNHSTSNFIDSNPARGAKHPEIQNLARCGCRKYLRCRLLSFSLAFIKPYQVYPFLMHLNFQKSIIVLYFAILLAPWWFYWLYAEWGLFSILEKCGTSMDVEKTRGPVLGRQTAVKNAGLRSVRSACGTTWSEVVDFAEQDTRISSGGRPLTAGDSSTWEQCKIIYDCNRFYMVYIFIQSSIRYIWYDITYILMIHWFLQHISVVLLPVTDRQLPDPSWLMADGISTQPNHVICHALLDTKGRVYVYIDAEFSWFFVSADRIHWHVHLRVELQMQSYIGFIHIYIYWIYWYFLNGHSFSISFLSRVKKWARRNTPWSWSQLSLPALMVCLGTDPKQFSPTVAVAGFRDFPVWRWQIYVYIYTYDSIQDLYIYNELCIV